MHLDYVKLGVSDSYFWFRGKYNLSKLLVAKFLSERKNSILLVGAGTGTELKFLKPLGDVDVIEIDPEAVKRIPKGSYRHAIIGDITKKPLRRNQYDAAVMYDVLEHIPKDLKAMKNILGALKSGGLLMMSVPAHQYLFSGHDRMAGHQRRYSMRMLKEVAKKAGFRIRYVGYWNFFLSPAHIAFRGVSKMRKSESYDYMPLHPAVNWFLFKVLSLENALIARGVRLPYGISIIAVLEKPSK